MGTPAGVMGPVPDLDDCPDLDAHTPAHTPKPIWTGGIPRRPQYLLERRITGLSGPGANFGSVGRGFESLARLETGLAIEARQEIVRLLVGQIVIHTDELPDGTRVARAVVHYRFPGAVQTDTGMGSSPR